MIDNSTVTPSSGNIFEDLGLPEPAELSAKADLVLALKELMQRQKLTQKAVASRCGTDPGTISKVLRGRLDLVSIERLFRWFNCLDRDVEIRITPRARGRASARSSVCALV